MLLLILSRPPRRLVAVFLVVNGLNTQSTMLNGSLWAIFAIVKGFAIGVRYSPIVAQGTPDVQVQRIVRRCGKSPFLHQMTTAFEFVSAVTGNLFMNKINYIQIV